MRFGVEDNDPQLGWTAPLARAALYLLVATGLTASAEVQSVRGLYDAQTARFQVTYGSPSRLSLGWEFQLFIDADDDATTGYWSGFDLLLRGVERANPPGTPGIPDSPDSGQLYLRATEGGVGPGGWGRVIATAPFAMTDDQHLTFDVPLGIGRLTDGHFRFTFESYYDGRLVDAVYDVWAEESIDDPTGPPICAVSTSEWQSIPFGSGGDTFSAQFHTIPNESPMSGHIALSEGEVITISDSPIVIRLDPSGRIEACNAGTFTADKAVPYFAGMAYHVRVDVNVLWRTYSVTVTAESCAPVVVARHYLFCADNLAVDYLDNWTLQAASGSHQVCGFTATECLRDSDDDGVANCYDWCPNDPEKTSVGACGCGMADIDLDGDDLPDCNPGDATGDGIVDLADWALFWDCMWGPDQLFDAADPVIPGTCGRAFDFDGDGDVETPDLARLLALFGELPKDDCSLGDANGDDTIDLYDFPALFDCLAGPDAVPTPFGTGSVGSCLHRFDYDGDADVDTSDLSRWLVCVGTR